MLLINRTESRSRLRKFRVDLDELVAALPLVPASHDGWRALVACGVRAPYRWVNGSEHIGKAKWNDRQEAALAVGNPGGIVVVWLCRLPAKTAGMQNLSRWIVWRCTGLQNPVYARSNGWISMVGSTGKMLCGAFAEVFKDPIAALAGAKLWG